MGCVIKKKPFIISNINETEREATELLTTKENKEIVVVNKKSKSFNNNLSDIARMVKVGEDLSKIIEGKMKSRESDNKTNKTVLKEIREENSEVQSLKSFRSLKSKKKKKSMAIYDETNEEKKGEKVIYLKTNSNDMKTTLKGIFFNVLKNNTLFTFGEKPQISGVRSVNNTTKEKMKTVMTNNSNKKITIVENKEEGENIFAENNCNNCNIYKPEKIEEMDKLDKLEDSTDSIFSKCSLSSETEKYKNLLDLNDDEEQDDIIFANTTTPMTPAYSLDNSPYQTIHSRHGSNNNNISSNKENTKSFLSNKANNKSEESLRSSVSPKSPSKITNYLQIKYDVFNRENTFKKIFLLNLKKSLWQVYKFLNLQKLWNKDNSVSKNYINIHNYISNYDVLNNHSYELETVVPHEQKDFIYPLYQVVSNNLEIKVSTIHTLKKDDKLINDTYEILQEISCDEMFKIWKVYKCRNIVKNTMCSIKIINKKQQNKLNFRNFTDHDINIENRMVYSKYSIKIKEFITSKLYDYIIMEYVDCSLYDLVVGFESDNMSENDFECTIYDSNLGIEEIWKLMRNLISAIDYCHNVAKIAHRNLNLKNVFFIKKDFSLKISDFSLSSFINDENEFLPYERNLICSYPPPEYNEDDYFGESGDIWASGILLFFMLNKYIPSGLGMLPSYLEIPDFHANKDLHEILKSCLKEKVEERVTLEELKNNNFITFNKEFPLPNVCEDTLDLIDKLTNKKPKAILSTR